MVCGYLGRLLGLQLEGVQATCGYAGPWLPMQTPMEDVFQPPECCACCIQLEKQSPGACKTCIMSIVLTD